MLILSRYQDERIVIAVGGEVVEVAIASVKGKKVRLGIKATPSVAIHRAEVWERIQRGEGDGGASSSVPV